MAALAMAPLQDVLNLGREARMNVPGRSDGNWAWRSPEESFTDEAVELLHELTSKSKRLEATRSPQGAPDGDASTSLHDQEKEVTQ
jgi:4-alpha-glucanotransferase